MRGPDDKEKKALAARPQSASYNVGYGKPPIDTRFRKGQSGNPNGRPRGSKNRLPAINEERLKSIILEEAYRTIKVNDGARQVSVPMAKAIIRSLAHNAVKGNTRAQRLFSEMLASTETANKRLHDEWLETAITYKIEWEGELERRRALGLNDLEQPIPHPDDIVIDMRTGAVRIKGPMTAEEKIEFDWWKGRYSEWQDELPKLRAEQKAESDPKIRQILQKEIEFGEKLLEKLRVIFPDPDPRITLREKIMNSKG